MVVASGSCVAAWVAQGPGDGEGEDEGGEAVCCEVLGAERSETAASNWLVTRAGARS